jgi:DnaJ-domain-containing protein 1
MFQLSRQGDGENSNVGPPTSSRFNARSLDGAQALQVLGLDTGASQTQIEESYRQLVSDLTPGPDASHRNVQLALHLLDEVNAAYVALRSGPAD